MDVTDELYAELIDRFNQLIGVLMCSIELGRIYIMREVSCLSQHLCSPREGHLNAVYKIFRYLQNNLSKNPGRISCDPPYVNTDEKVLKGSTRDLKDSKYFYPDTAEDHQRNNLEPLGEPVTIWVYVDENYAGNLSTRTSHSGILIYLNNVLINFHIKRQNTVESPIFGSECVVLRIATEMVEALRYKLRKFSVNLESLAEVYFDNKSAVKNSIDTRDGRIDILQ